LAAGLKLKIKEKWKMKKTRNITIREDVVKSLIPVLHKINQGECFFETHRPISIKRAKTQNFLTYRCRTIRDATAKIHFFIGVIEGYTIATGRPLCDGGQINNY